MGFLTRVFKYSIYKTNFSWQETVQRIQEVGEKKKKIQKDLEEESEESIDQMAFRGIRQQIAKKDGIDVSFLKEVLDYKTSDLYQFNQKSGSNRLASFLVSTYRFNFSLTT